MHWHCRERLLKTLGVHARYEEKINVCGISLRRSHNLVRRQDTPHYRPITLQYNRIKLTPDDNIIIITL
jgi:hypothetical protein